MKGTPCCAHLSAVGERVRLLGFVLDLAPVYATTRLAVAPLRFGAGLKGKVLEAWAAGIPCAMTPIAAEGLPLFGEPATCVANDAASLAQLLIDLHTDAARAERIARAGRTILRRHFSRKAEQVALGSAITTPRHTTAVHLLRVGPDTPKIA